MLLSDALGAPYRPPARPQLREYAILIRRPRQVARKYGLLFALRYPGRRRWFYRVYMDLRCL